MTFFTGPVISFGNHALDQVNSMSITTKVKRVLIITDKGIVGCELLDPLNAQLKRSKGALFDGIEEIPSEIDS